MLPLESVEEVPDHIGEQLQKAREKAGLTVDDVLFKTRIPRSVILALEAGDFSVFCSPTYAKSFLSQYSDFLNVDADLWLNALQPASFISGESVNPLWQAATPRREEMLTERESSNSWVAAASLLGISCGLVYAAIKGYEFFEARFGVDLVTTPTTVEVAEAAADSSSSAPPEEEAEPLEDRGSLVNRADAQVVQPPPRAIIVRP